MDARKRGKGATTLTDVAELAGVSLATASKAINGVSQVRAETRQKVLDAAAALSFTPNPFAKALNSATTGTIGMLTQDLDNRFVLPVLLGAEDAFGAGSTSVLLADARSDSIRENHQLNMLLAKRVDGLLVVGRTTNPRPSITAGLSIPVVYVYAPSEDPEDLSFTPDNHDAGRQAVEHLLSRGRRRIAFINGDPSYTAARDRVAGAAERMREEGLSLVGGTGLFGPWGERWGRRCTESLVESGERFDALLCGSDQLARGALDQLRESALSVPDDVAVMGFDNWDVLAEEARPPLTSVEMNLQQLGRSAAQQLVRAIGGTSARGVRLGSVRVVPRESTGSWTL
ncbi:MULTISPECIES: LacI family DNA-binding transcriptional regulator [Subtercola]|uniref:LacI family transcriptional regulator n=1 Tax=Subtercola vilae TaxID=2056433 RepID=A0A4T2C6U6_9MICO|nr:MULTISPECIES: LacI family DNA-binding transcriptional regulator [Subtercola]MEA9984286.1 LacI family DNA-binding transcriptional regulator [Subtercola sp. RTI3]TIH40143.1 LacI family transcriptional regulator [Subtercola vilae]